MLYVGTMREDTDDKAQIDIHYWKFEASFTPVTEKSER